jgi:hypothetical protein
MTKKAVLDRLVPQMEEHLASLKIGYDAPIPFDNWAAMEDLTRDKLHGGLRTHYPELLGRYFDALRKRRSNIKKALAKVPTPSYANLASIAKKFGVTPKDLQRRARYYGYKVKVGPIIDPERIARVAKVGMTVRELADAAGCKFATMQCARSSGRLKSVIDFKLVERTTPRGGTRLMIVSSIRIPK